MEIAGTGLGTVGGPGGGGLRFVATPDEIAAILADIDRAGFGAMPTQFGLPYVGHPVDWVRPPDPSDPPRFTRTPPRWALTVERGDRGKTVTQSAEGERSEAFEALAASVWAAVGRAADARPVRTRNLAEDIAWLRDGRLPAGVFALSAGRALAHDGIPGRDWTAAVAGRRVEIRGPAPGAPVVGTLRDDEWAALLDALGAEPLPDEVPVPARGGAWLGAAAVHRVAFRPGKRVDSVRVPPGVQAAFDRAFAVVERIRERIAGR